MSNAPRNATNEAASESGKAARGPDIQADIEALRRDTARLAQQIADILGSKGDAAWSRAKSNLEGVMSDAEEKGREALSAVREVGDNIAGGVDESLKRRPYTTLGLALGLGFLFGATWRR